VALPRLSVDQIREAAESDLISFIRLVAPHRVIPHFQEDWITWLTRRDAKDHQLTLLPRDHAKSTIIAYRAAWEVVKDPTIRILYISSTANLAEKQLGLIKQILSSTVVRRYWPDLVNEEEGKREKWTQSEIAVDDPRRLEEGIRDPTIFTGGLTTSLTGMHCDIAILDDVVVQENAYTEEGREKVKSQYSLLASIEGAGAREWVVGTRYHPQDLYSELVMMEEETYDKEGNVTDSKPVYEVYQRVVEEHGEFLWPRQQRNTDGKWFGFDSSILAKKKAQYLDKTQFYAQYYNDPNRFEAALITPDKFQYYERHQVKRGDDGKWYVRNSKISIAAAMDFAFSTGKKSDYTAIAVVGLDSSGNYYLLDLDRFKTDRIDEMFEHLRTLYSKWEFRKIRMEMTAAQATVAKELRDQYIKPMGLALAVDEYYPTKRDGDKEERIAAVLAPRYGNNQMWHFRGGHTQSLEDELVQRFPVHDDLSDALCNAVLILTPPASNRKGTSNVINLRPHSRFGGV
jgi:phage terminase large subunit-like protein